MPDPIPLTDHWVGNAITATVTAVIAVGGTIFSTRKRSEATLMAQVDTKVMGFADRLTAEIERLDRAITSERAECQRQLAAQDDKIARLVDELMKGSVPGYSDEAVNRALHPRGKS